MKFLHAQLLVLAFLGLCGTWGSMALNGSIWTMIEAALNGELPSGRLMRTEYTGFLPADFLLSMLVAFFDGVSNSLHLPSYHIMIDICTMLQSAAIWTLVYCQKGGNQAHDLAYAALFGTLGTIFAASVMVPLWCYMWLQQPSQQKDASLARSNSKILFVSLALGALIPLVPLLPPVFTSDIDVQQKWIALFQVMPFSLVVAHYLVSAISGNAQAKPDRSDFVNVYTLTGIYSSLGHLYVLMKLFNSDNINFNFWRVYMPTPSFVSPVAPSRMIEGAHLFLQFDWIVLSLTGIVFSYLLLDGFARSGLQKILLASLVAVSNLTLGPGGGVSFAYAYRERHQQQKDSAVKRK